MRVAYLCTDFGIPVHGSKGAAIHVRELSQALHNQGHEVAVFAARAGEPTTPGYDIPVHEIAPEPPERRCYDLLRADPAAGEAAAKEIRGLLHAADFRHRVAPRLHAFAADLIYERYSLLGTAGLSLAHELAIPLILEVNAPLSDEQAAHRGLHFAATARALEREIVSAADHVIAVSRPLAEWLIACGVAPERVSILPNGVDVDRFAAGAARRNEIRARLGIAPNQAVVGFVGTLKAWHGTANLIRAVAALRHGGVAPSLLIVGEGPQRAELTALAAAEEIAAATTFTGAVGHDEMPGYLAAMDVAVAPYDAAPNFYFSPLKLFEYLAAGRPVVAAAIGQVAECVAAGETGLLYPPGDVAALAAAIESIVADPSRAASLGRAGQAYVRAHHTWAGNARAVADLVRTAPPTPQSWGETTNDAAQSSPRVGDAASSPPKVGGPGGPSAEAREAA
ncbi:MAG: glycosyltransferase family 4 protein [Thermomicrobiales bacterium]